MTGEHGYDPERGASAPDANRQYRRPSRLIEEDRDALATALLQALVGDDVRTAIQHGMQLAEYIRDGRTAFEDALDELLAAYRDDSVRLSPQELRAGITLTGFQEHLRDGGDQVMVLFVLALERLATLDATQVEQTRRASMAQATPAGTMPEDVPQEVFHGER